MTLALSIALFAAFFANVAYGAVTGHRALGDVGEALTLFAASVAFTHAILAREARGRARLDEGGPDAP